MTLLTPLLAVAVSFAQPTSSPSPADLADLRCLLAGDSDACVSSFLRAGAGEDAATFARVGCAGNSLRSCVNLGDWLAKRADGDQAARLTEAESVFLKACRPDFGLGCARLIPRAVTAAISGDEAAVRSTLERIRPWLDIVCSDAGGAKAYCPEAKQSEARLRRRLDDRYRDCHLEITPYTRAGAGEVIVRPRAAGGDGLMLASECAASCTEAFARATPPTPDTVFVRGICRAGTQRVPASLWRSFRRPECVATAREIGAQGQRALRCYCESEIYPKANAISEAQGAFVVAEVADVTRVGRHEWARCAAGVYLDPETRAAPDCAARVERVKAQLAGESTLRGIVIKTDRLTCAKAP